MSVSPPNSALPWREMTLRLEAFAHAASLDDLLDLSTPMVSSLGGRMLALAWVSPAGTGCCLKLGAGVYPEDRRSRYEAADLGRRDPLAQIARAAKRPFPLADALQDASPETTIRRHYEERGTGFGTGYPVPRSPIGGLQLVVFAGPAAVVDPELEVQRHLMASTFGDEALLRLSPSSPPVRLTPRQLACLSAAARGCSSAQIAAELGLAPKTVDAYLAAAARLGARNRISAVAVAVRNGLI